MIAQATPQQIRLAQERRARLERLGSYPAPLRPSEILSHEREADVPPPTPKALWFWIESVTPIIRIEQIQKAVCIAYGVDRTCLLSARRTTNIIRPRQVAMYLAKTMTLKSLPEIGRRFGGRDHTTILHGVRKIEALMQRDLELAAEIEALKSEITGGNA